MVFIGYEPNTKAYHFWSTHWQWIFISTTAVFDETVFPYCLKEEDYRPAPQPLRNEDFNLTNEDEVIPEQPQQYIYIPQPLGLGAPSNQQIPPRSRQGSGHSTPSTTPWVPPSILSSSVPHIPSPSFVDEDPLFDDPTPTPTSSRTAFSPPHPGVKRTAPDSSQKSSLTNRHQYKGYIYSQWLNCW